MIKTGTILGDRYEILEKIGTGGMAEVFKGKDHKLNRYVAVKVLKEEFRDNDGFVKKFKEEAQAAAGLAHPNIVNVYDVGDENGIYYIVMELVEGITLKNYIERKGRLTIKRQPVLQFRYLQDWKLPIIIILCTGILNLRTLYFQRRKSKGNRFWYCRQHFPGPRLPVPWVSVHYASPGAGKRRICRS